MKPISNIIHLTIVFALILMAMNVWSIQRYFDFGQDFARTPWSFWRTRHTQAENDCCIH